MLCQRCQRAEATLHLTSVKACKPFESHYCEPCSRTLDLRFPFAFKGAPAPPPPPP